MLMATRGLGKAGSSRKGYTVGCVKYSRQKVVCLAGDLGVTLWDRSRAQLEIQGEYGEGGGLWKGGAHDQSQVVHNRKKRVHCSGPGVEGCTRWREGCTQGLTRRGVAWGKSAKGSAHLRDGLHTVEPMSAQL